MRLQQDNRRKSSKKKGRENTTIANRRFKDKLKNQNKIQQNEDSKIKRKERKERMSRSRKEKKISDKTRKNEHINLSTNIKKKK